jgi:hypothetical protein
MAFSSSKEDRKKVIISWASSPLSQGISVSSCLFGIGISVDVGILLCGVAVIIFWTFGPGAERTVE